MQQQGVRPSRVTFNCVLNACASLGVLEKGLEVHDDILKAGVLPYLNLENTLVDMYAKCGSVQDSSKVFNSISERNVVSWNVMIAGYSQHGCDREVLHLFEQMRQEGKKCITFSSLLSTCSHVGLVDKAQEYFDSMSRDHGLTPTKEHFGCMVDLLGRVGLLEEVKDFIHKMPIKPHVGLWRALLGACQIHDVVEIAERATKSLLEIDPQDEAGYVLLSNIYAAAGRWDDKAKLWKMLEDRGGTRAQLD